MNKGVGGGGEKSFLDTIYKKRAVGGGEGGGIKKLRKLKTQFC